MDTMKKFGLAAAIGGIVFGILLNLMSAVIVGLGMNTLAITLGILALGLFQCLSFYFYDQLSSLPEPITWW